MLVSQTRHQFALFGVAGVAIAASLAVAALTLSSSDDLHFQTYKEIPMPFAFEGAASPLQGSILTIGLYNDIPVDEVFYTLGEATQLIQDDTHEDRLFFVRTPSNVSTMNSIAAAFGFASDDLTHPNAPEVYLYIYSDESATAERNARAAGETQVNGQFPGLFLAMGDESIAAMEAFAEQYSLTFDHMNTTALMPNALMLVVINDTNVAFDILCGNGTVDAGEVCDDGNPDSTDACTSACEISICSDAIIQPNGSDVGSGYDDEICDDGNSTPEDGCSSICRPEFCGDLVIQRGGTLNEQCDNGRACIPPPPGIAPPSVTDCDTPLNAQTCVNEAGTCAPVDGDGCDASCQLEQNSCNVSSSSTSSLSSLSSSIPASSSAPTSSSAANSSASGPGETGSSSTSASSASGPGATGSSSTSAASSTSGPGTFNSSSTSDSSSSGGIQFGNSSSAVSSSVSFSSSASSEGPIFPPRGSSSSSSSGGIGFGQSSSAISSSTVSSSGGGGGPITPPNP